MKIRFTLRSLLTIPLLFAIVLAGLWWLPKSRPLSINPDYIGHYRGLGLIKSPDFFGMHFYRISVMDGENGHCEVDCGASGYNQYRGFYPNGVCREEGECFVEMNGSLIEPVPDLHNVRSAKYYKPDGTLGSEVTDGTGTQTYWYPDGIKRWELVLDDYKRSELKTWYANGQLQKTKQFVDAKAHGEVKSFHENGQLKVQGEFANGKNVGVWIFYDESGKVTNTIDHTVTPMKITES